MTSTSTVSVEPALGTMLSAPVANSVAQTSAVASSVNSDSGNNKRETATQVVDTVTLQGKVLDNKQAEAKTEALKESKSKEKDSKQQEVRSSSHVLLAYNSKGNLRIKFMDSGNNLIYQTPPVLFARMTDLMLQFKSSVNTRA